MNITKAVGALNLDSASSDDDNSNCQDEKVIYLGDDIPVVIKPPSLPNRNKQSGNKNKQKKANGNISRKFVTNIVSLKNCHITV